MSYRVVSYRNSTSNHNYREAANPGGCVVSYRNSTSNHNTEACFIKRAEVVSYRNSTSNHNCTWFSRATTVLYLIEILHQTTTLAMSFRNTWGCILSKFYIKPQLIGLFAESGGSCILSKFYIKPQHLPSRLCGIWVVSYRNSTSNHNVRAPRPVEPSVVSYRNSTSNHNSKLCPRTTRLVVSYRNSTSNHNFRRWLGLYSKVVSYRNSTSNHNISQNPSSPKSCCILSKFYIKPQPLTLLMNFS